MAATAWMPVLTTDVPFFSADVQLIALKRALFIFAVTLPFDIRDYDSDLKTDVTTLPQILGMRGARWLAMACISGFALIAYIQFYPNYLQAFYSLEITAIVSAILIWYASPKRHEYYYTGALDGTLVLQLVLLLLFHKIW
jgi:4-hydroxybenzoate polyprenyltransferase